LVFIGGSFAVIVHGASFGGFCLGARRGSGSGSRELKNKIRK
jgi:hypothetical protein